MVEFFAGTTMKCPVADTYIGVVKGIIQDLDAMLIAQPLSTVVAYRLDLDVFSFLLSAFSAFPGHGLLL